MSKPKIINKKSTYIDLSDALTHKFVVAVKSHTGNFVLYLEVFNGIICFFLPKISVGKREHLSITPGLLQYKKVFSLSRV